MRDHWRPDADFLVRLNKRQLLSIGGHIHGEPWASAHAATKKAVLVEILVDTFSAESARPMPEDACERAARWLPDGMAFATPQPEMQATV